MIPYVGYLFSTASVSTSLFKTFQPENNGFNSQGVWINAASPVPALNTTSGSTTKIVNSSNGVTSYYGYNVMGFSAGFQLAINASEFVDTGSLHLNGTNYVGTFGYGSSYVTSSGVGAVARKTILIVPAYTIHGTVYNDSGQIDKNAEIVLKTPSSNYYIWTNSKGQYSFFAKPGVEYFLTSPSASMGGIQIYPSTNNMRGKTYNLHLTNLEFSENGIEGSQAWSVKLNGPALPTGNEQTYTSPSTTGSSITIGVVGSESYGYHINSPNDYVASPNNQNVNVGTALKQVNITFTAENTYSVSFTESGIPSGVSWRVTLAGYGQSSTSSTITFNGMPDGNYSWQASNSYYYSYPRGTYYFPSPSSGTVHVSGSNMNVQISYHARNSVSGNTPILMANGSYMFAKDITVGMHIATYNLTTHHMQNGVVLTATKDIQSSAYIVNGFLNLSSDQLVLTNNGWMPAKNLSNGDLVVNPYTGHYTRVHSIQLEHGSLTMYGFVVGTNDNYIALSYVVYRT